MAKSAIVSDKLAEKFKNEKETPYTRFIASEGLDIINGNYVESLHEVRTMFADALSENGLTPNMDAAYEAELPDLPPKA